LFPIVPAVSEIGLYSDPEIYDILHWPGTLAEFRGLERGWRAFARTRTSAAWTVLESACGTGRLLRIGARRGYRVAGFDLSAAMVEYARKSVQRERLKAGRARAADRVVVADMTSFAGEFAGVRVDAAFCPINTIRHLASDAAMLAHLEQVALVLKRGGVYLVGLTTSMPRMESPSEDVWEGSRGRLKVTQVVSFMPPERGRSERVHSHLMISGLARGMAAPRHRDSSYTLRTYTLKQWLKLIDASALRLVGVVDAEGKEISAPELGYGVWVLEARG
jgi:SAM-dependent methyltransferase